MTTRGFGRIVNISSVTVPLVTIDGSSGNVYLGALGTSGADAPAELEQLLAWADAIARGHVQVRANADTEDDASQGRRLGAQGIGLCRTEHMFLAADRLPVVRRFILAATPETEQAARECLSLPVHPSLSQGDLERIVTAVNALVKAGA